MATKRSFEAVVSFEVRDEREDELNPVDWQHVLAELALHGVEPRSLMHQMGGASHCGRFPTRCFRPTHHPTVQRGSTMLDPGRDT